VGGGGATAQEAAERDIGDGGLLMVARSLNVDMAGQPVQFSETRFAAERVEITIDPS